jgi:cysteine-rich repeat protein
MRYKLLVLVGLAIVGAGSVAFGGPLPDGSEFQINSYTTSTQYPARARSVARNPDGSFVVVWGSVGQDGDIQGVYGQRFDSTGAAVGTEFQVNSYTTYSQRSPAVASASDGSFVVVWDDSRSNGTIFGQRFDSSGAAAGTEFLINTVTSIGYAARDSAVSVAGDGSIIVVWSPKFGQDGSADSVRGQRFDSTGTPSGTEFQVNSYTTGGQGNPAVASASDGSFVVVWNSYGQDGSANSIHGQRFDSLGAAVGTEFQINSYTTDQQHSPAISARADGDFVVVWSSRYQDGSSAGIHGQRFSSTGTPSGTEFQVNSYTTGDQYQPCVAMAPDGEFVVVWHSYGGQDGAAASVHGQRFDSAGTPEGTEFQVNTYTTGYQYAASVAADATGDFIVVWSSYIQDGDSSGVFGQRFCVDENSNLMCDSAETTTTTTTTTVTTSTTTTSSTTTTTLSTCGDGLLDAGEACDDGDNDNGDGCASDCTCEPTPDGDSDGLSDVCDNCPIVSNASQIDADDDGVGDACDNCLAAQNPDQTNSDCPAPAFFLAGNCPVDPDATSPKSRRGCCDGGDACDVCPADKLDQCDPQGSTSVLVDPDTGGTVTTPNGMIEIEIPPGALDQPTVISITDGSGPYKLQVGGGVVHNVSFGPQGLAFNVPVTVRMRWNDTDADNVADLGLCADALTPCDSDASCTLLGKPTPCSAGGVAEADLVLKKNGTRFSMNRCDDHYIEQAGTNGCNLATAGDGGGACADPADRAARCCDRSGNEWEYELCGFSELYLGDAASDLIPGNGSPATDCVAEWQVDNPQNTPVLDKKGRVSFDQSCTDGDPMCDADGAVDGKCVFDVGVCMNLADGRLQSGGTQACTPTEVQSWEIKKPRPDSTKPIDAANGASLRDAVAALGTSSIGGTHQGLVTFGPALATAAPCSTLVPLTVVLKGPNQDRKARATLSTSASAAPPVGMSGNVRDGDKLKLTCLPD